MSKVAFSDFESFADALRGVDGRYTILDSRPRGPWWLTQVQVGRLVLQIGEVGGARLYEGATPASLVSFYVPVPQEGSMWFEDRPLRPGHVLSLAPGAPISAVTKAQSRWATISVPTSMLKQSAEIRGLSEGRSSQRNTIIEAGSRTARRLVSSIECASRQAASSPLDIELQEDYFMDAIFGLLWPQQRAHRHLRGRPRISRDLVLQRAIERINDAVAGETVSIEELCRVTRVSERTLREVFLERCGVGPTRYMHLRQLHRFRRALLVAKRHQETVRRIALRLFGTDSTHLLRDYKALFGETPGQTLGLGETAANVPRAASTH